MRLGSRWLAGKAQGKGKETEIGRQICLMSSVQGAVGGDEIMGENVKNYRDLVAW